MRPPDRDDATMMMLVSLTFLACLLFALFAGVFL